ncbi:hypothetical protein RE6C_03257 [Rhodopirellula europaea 6C]|uniref:Uncharacterized protein n=1 Tax=Rhodopirellula europaea 6C TaxID=1263867 RepID=M2B1C7_9BACT|nr:hypothetical protein RE6C_03257 [Rhodopirellula europaea 6C]
MANCQFAYRGFWGLSDNLPLGAISVVIYEVKRIVSGGSVLNMKCPFLMKARQIGFRGP